MITDDVPDCAPQRQDNSVLLLKTKAKLWQARTQTPEDQPGPFANLILQVDRTGYSGDASLSLSLSLSFFLSFFHFFLKRYTCICAYTHIYKRVGHLLDNYANL